MSEPAASFIKEESLSTRAGALALNLRLFRALPLFLKLLPLSVMTILLSSAAPSFFRWYSGCLLGSSPSIRVPILGWNLDFTLAGLLWITFLATSFRIAAWAFFEISGMWSSQGIHQRMVRAMTLTRTTFFDENPSGRLINRLIRDFDEVRSTAIIFVGDFFNASVEVLSIGVMASLASPWAGLLILPLLAIFSYIQFQRSAMLDHARNLSAIATSQVLGRETDLIEGRELFLLYGQAGRLLERMRLSFRSYIQAQALTSSIETWASFWMRFSAEGFSFCAMIVMIFALARDRMDPALVGVILSSLFGITGSIGWLDFSTGLISRSTPHLRRIFEFVDLPREEMTERARPIGDAKREKPSEGGRQEEVEGELRFVDYTMSYRPETPIILEGLDLSIPLGKKTALVGRTGSGKTSLVQALLRMVYVHRGDIRLGERSIFDWELLEFRKLFGVVPQAPYLFAGTIRSNLDRLGALPPRSLESALGAVGLELSLEHPIAEGGRNLSTGERQLVCLARVIAADKKIILMDEPTSGLDPQTDARVSHVLKTALERKTVLTIAHRRETLGSYDRIVEMRAGKAHLLSAKPT